MPETPGNQSYKRFADPPLIRPDFSGRIYCLCHQPNLTRYEKTTSDRIFADALRLLRIGTAIQNHKEPRVRFGVGYRYSLGLTEKYKIVSDFGKITSPWGAPEYLRGGELRFEVTVRLTPDWNVGAGTGFGSYDDQGEKTFLGYLKAERLYGKRASRWFNYAEAGATFYPDNGAGLTGSLGGGYRLAMTRRTRLDFTAGLEYLNLVGKANIYDNSTGEFIGIEKRGARFNRFGITFGIAMHF